MRHHSPFLCALSAREAQNGFQPGTALAQVFPHIPESKQSQAEAQCPIAIQRLKQPVECETEIVDLDVALGQPASSMGGAQFGFSFLRQYETVCRMCPPRRRLLTAIG